MRRSLSRKLEVLARGLSLCLRSNCLTYMFMFSCGVLACRIITWSWESTFDKAHFVSRVLMSSHNREMIRT